MNMQIISPGKYALNSIEENKILSLLLIDNVMYGAMQSSLGNALTIKKAGIVIFT